MEGHWKFLGGGGGVLKATFLEAIYENKVEFPGGGGGVAKQKTFCGGSMDIFGNCTIHNTAPIIIYQMLTFWEIIPVQPSLDFQ